jgi:hypothetical protein
VSGYKRKYRAKFVEENTGATGPSNYFRDLNNTSDIKVNVLVPYFKSCEPLSVSIDNHGIIEFNMTILNGTIPYLMKV